MLVELSVMEQRYQAVLAVIQDGWKVVEVAQRMGVSRQTVHNWIARYNKGGLASLADHSHRPLSCAHQISPLRPSSKPRSASFAASIQGGALAGPSTSSPGSRLSQSPHAPASTGVCAGTA